jgi:hypothetical protein
MNNMNNMNTTIVRLYFIIVYYYREYPGTIAYNLLRNKYCVKILNNCICLLGIFSRFAGLFVFRKSRYYHCTSDVWTLKFSVMTN